MSTLTFIRKILSPFLFFNIVNRCRGRSALVKIKAAQVYVVGVKKMRILFLGVLLVIFSFLLLGIGSFLIHSALFVYSPWSPQIKFIVALVLGGIEFIGAIVILFYLSREESWFRFYGIQDVINSVVKSNPDQKIN